MTDMQWLLCCTSNIQVHYLKEVVPWKLSGSSPAFLYTHPTQEDQRSLSPTPGLAPTTPHSSRSNPRPCCTDPAAIRFTTSKTLPPKSYMETAQWHMPDLVYQLSLVVQEHHVKVCWCGLLSGVAMPMVLRESQQALCSSWRIHSAFGPMCWT